MNIEDELRGALDVSAPPPTTTLDHVLKRGRRRVFAQRAGAVLGVFAVVAGIGIGATTLNQAAPPEPADQPNHGPATVEHSVGWPRVNTPARTPYGTWTPTASAGGAAINIPLCTVKAPSVPRERGLGAQPLAPELVAKWRDQVQKLVPEMTIGTVTGFPSNVFFEFDVSDSSGTGSVMVWAARFAGTPQASADDGLWETGDCEPARRLVQPDGSVVQLHAVRPVEPLQAIRQALAVYRKDGLLIQIEQRNHRSGDVAAHNPANPDVTRRPTLPLTDEQFSRLGPIIAEGV
ncbi:hypothetical protein SAMN04488564_104447 [Lentzea waywayandensis]|uniref:Uncharacterized protein n=1 Tax=Lentzea waywayandensis TaxID=84724 RepID=A0A1I6EGY3_9PSEU|nr:hypothetical protein [Lentzea waywayandensis]SFR16811.1 hypothetical protein SAMN04488564_104447 [Lentzea waywayandensis]